MSEYEALHLESAVNKPIFHLSFTGKILVGFTGGVAFGLTVICTPFVTPALRKFCLPYVPATTEQLSNIFQALKGRQGTLLDLGSGDGRIVIEAAKNKFKSDGVELNPWLVLYSKFNAFKSGQTRLTQFYRKDLWKYNVGKYDNIVIFGVEQMMADLEKKFIKECKPECNVIACRFPLPNLTPIKTIGHGIDTVWIYNVKET
ncbi:ATP synthase subunit C lysine N-methyltransferase [Anthonomus grandis grandis]|uniref:ATP synthase subunit C lysine N-methyltransferase n=1 Tax=Anthonomus grandis grandis TaxID=2921223 RepID=UPI0021651F6B|nr:ATP synthase subunit C lysine N-methyltransferase [Anthonomus grandis grandis]